MLSTPLISMSSSGFVSIKYTSVWLVNSTSIKYLYT